MCLMFPFLYFLPLIPFLRHRIFSSASLLKLSALGYYDAILPGSSWLFTSSLTPFKSLWDPLLAPSLSVGASQV